ncbi:zinc finger domain-containing protein [Streptomyces uncialis]
MPDSLRALLRAQHHPARTVPCPHCRARAGTPCVLRTTGRHLPQPHPARITAWNREDPV